MKLAMDRWDNSSPKYNEQSSYLIAQNAVIALFAYPSLSNEIGNALIHLAAETDDITLRNLSLQLAAKNCSELIQAVVWDMTQRESTLELRIAAVDAIALSPRLHALILEKISTCDLNGHPASLAVSLVRLITLQQEVEELGRRLAQLSRQPSQRALLVVGMSYMRDRDRDVAEHISRLLGKDHPVCTMLNSPEKKLPRSVLNDLGDVRIRNAVQTRMAWLFLKG